MYNWFKNGHKSLKDEPATSKSDENVAKVHTIMRLDQHLTSEIANETGISYGLVSETCVQNLCHTFLWSIGMINTRSKVSTEGGY